MLAHEHFAGVFFCQQIGFLIAVSTYDGLDFGIDRPGSLDHAPHLHRIGCGDYQHARSRDMRLDEDGRVRGISGDGRYAGLAQLFDDLTVLPSATTKEIPF